MEESAMDELYGDFGQRHTDSSLIHDEDSVDIYSGLDECPNSDGGKGKDGTFLSPVRLKESMDLYEELITKEQEEKDATYNELKSKYDAAQNQIKELRAQLQLMQTKNSSLHRENTLLKKNICALIKTARMEIVRKDEEISKLSKRPVWSGLQQSRMEKNQELRLKSQSNTGPSVKDLVNAGSINESQNVEGYKRLPEVSEHRDGSRTASHPVHKVTTTDATQPPVSQRCTRNNMNSPKYCQGKVSDGAVQDCSRVQSNRTSDGKTREEGASSEVEVRRSLCSETAGKQLESRGQGKERLAQQTNNQNVECNPREKDVMSKPQCDVNKSERSQKESVKVNSASNRSQCQATEDSVILRRSVRSKSPQPMSPSEFHSQMSKVDSQTQGRKQEFRHQGEDRNCRSEPHSRSEMNSSEKSGSSLDRRMEKRVSREHHKVSDGAVQDCSRVQSNRTSDDKTREGASSEVEVRKSLCSETAGRQLQNRGQGKERLAQQTNNQNVERNPREKDVMSKPQCDVNKSERSQKESVKVNSASNRVHHRKEERRQEGAGSSERRRTRSDDCKGYEQKKARESEGRNREEGNSYSRGDRRSTRSEASKEYERRNSKESDRGLTRGASDKVDKRVKDQRDAGQADVPKNRRDTSPLNHDRVRSRRKDHDQEINKRKTCSKTEEQVSRSKASISCDNSRDGKSPLFNVTQHNSDRHSSREKDVIGYDKLRGKADNEKRIGSLCEKSANGIPAADVTKSTSSDKSKTDHNRHAGETVQTQCLASVSKRSPLKLPSSCDNSAMAEESSPKRKLSFMETLNLTVSPIKKQRKLSEAEKPIGQHPEEASSVSIELGEEFCVIDEIENSQESVETIDDDLALAAGNAVDIHPSNSDAQSSQGQDKIPGSKEPKTGLQEMEVKEKELELSKDFGEAMSLDVVSPSVKVCLNSKASVTKIDMSANSSASISKKCAHNSDCAVDKTETAKVNLLSEDSVSVNDVSGPSVEDVCKDLSPSVPREDSKANSRKESQIDSEPEPLPPPPPPVQIDNSQEEVSTTAEVHHASDTCSNTDTSASLEIVSSTVSVDVNPESEDGSAYTQRVTLDVEITRGLEKLHSCLKPSEGTQAETVNTSNPLKEVGSLSEQTSSSEPDSTENELLNSRLVGPVVVPQDEDSMMLTLSNIKVIPEAISPLTSPVRQIRIAQHGLGMEPHVRSLSKELSTAATVTDKDAIKTDMNKENKQPDLPFKPSVVKAQQEVLSATAAEEELEEGEINSNSDEESSPCPPCEKTKPISKNQPSLRLPRLEKRASPETPAITSTREQDQSLTATSKESPTSSKRRFKTITVPPKAKISTPAEFMNMLLFIRSELRRKYMKLHKNFTKSAFCCIVDMSQASFTEFVDGVNFQTFSIVGNEIKPRLNKIISSVMGKASNNGIVNRIFEQQADDLKQKLWNFVDGQFDFLFKELKAALKSVSVFSNNKSFDGKYSNSTVKDSLKVEVCKIQPKKPLSTAEPRPNTRDKAKDLESKQRIMPLHSMPLPSMPCRIRGLGSRGKNISASMEDGAQSSDQPSAVFSSEMSVQENVPVPETKTPIYARHLSHSGSNQDRTDFEILTEQQTSSLTFNLVTDSQMGDIFRCLLQGSDLLEANVAAGDNQCWPLNTPRKECAAGESLIGIVTPNKIITPSKLITTWTSISPYKLASPNNKVQMPLNPVLFDESCLLEVPSNAPGLTTGSQHSFSILAEDLAVSLTIPSPLKSEGHLSFLHPTNGQPLSAPSSVISAHFNEDALMDGEDATEQDIHLSLDTDNSSCGSSSAQTWEECKQKPVFHFKPDLPMQAEVMERSNDHFIVRIRHTSTSAPEETPKELKEAPSAVEASTACLKNNISASQRSLDNSSPLMTQPPVTSISSNSTEAQMPRNDRALEGGVGEHTSVSLPKITENPPEQAADPSYESASSDTTAAFEKKEGAPESNSTCERTSRKRRKHHSGPKSKRSRTEKHQDRHEKQRHKKRSRSCKEKGEKTPPKKGNGNLQESPNLSAKNVIRKKGEVVVTWTRDEDRDILVDLKMKGPSSKTFVALSTKLKKSPAQIEERFTQLMKLLKKKEKMDS